MTTVGPDSTLRVLPLTPQRWPDLERLFGPRGGCGGCWCMWWRLPAAQFAAQKGERNRQALHALVESGTIAGILAYAGGDPIGWCAVEPRTAYPRLARSRALAPVDALPVWSVSCFYIAASHRRRGVATQLLRAAVDHVRKRRGRVIEGYPVVPRSSAMAPAFAWTGFAASFERAGFRECARRTPTRPIMRRVVDDKRRGAASAHGNQENSDDR